MIKNLIVIENGKYFQFEDEQDLVKNLICQDYYNLPQEKKIEKLKIKAIANSFNTKKGIPYNITNEKDFILSLLVDNDKFILLEKKGSNIFTKNLDKIQFTKNYIIVNKFAKQLLNIR